jgi:hypothetical protein
MLDLSLQKIVLIMALVAFIFAIMVIYYKSLPTSQNEKWPPVTAKCPDYWDLSENLCVNTSGMNKGKLEYATCNGSGNYPCCTDGTCYFDISTISNNKEWAKDNGFVWDGLTSG